MTRDILRGIPYEDALAIDVLTKDMLVSCNGHKTAVIAVALARVAAEMMLKVPQKTRMEVLEHIILVVRARSEDP